MQQEALMSKMSTNTNQYGVAFFISIALTNAEIDYSQLKPNIGTENYVREARLFDEEVVSTTASNEAVNLFDTTYISDAELVVNFARKIIASTVEIDPEIQSALKKRFRDL